MPSAPVGSTGCVRPNATNTSGCTLGITNESIRQPFAACVPASTAACTPAVSPPIITIYLPEQMDRDSNSRTVPAFNIVSATSNPAATDDNSINPMDLSCMLASVQNDMFVSDSLNHARKRRVNDCAHRFLG